MFTLLFAILSALADAVATEVDLETRHNGEAAGRAWCALAAADIALGTWVVFTRGPGGGVSALASSPDKDEADLDVEYRYECFDGAYHVLDDDQLVECFG